MAPRPRAGSQSWDGRGMEVQQPGFVLFNENFGSKVAQLAQFGVFVQGTKNWLASSRKGLFGPSNILNMKFIFDLFAKPSKNMILQHLGMR